MWVLFPSLYAFQCRYSRCVNISAFTFEFFTSSSFFALHSASACGVPSHSGYTSDSNRMFFPIRRPQFPTRFGRNIRQPMLPSHRSSRLIEIRNPDLRSVFFSRNERKTLSIRRPARPVRILIGNNFSLASLLSVIPSERSRMKSACPERLTLGKESNGDLVFDLTAPPKHAASWC